MLSLHLSTADGAAGRVHSSSNQQPAELFPPGAAEPERGAASVLRRHQRVSVAVHGRQTLETDRLPLNPSCWNGTSPPASSFTMNVLVFYFLFFSLFEEWDTGRHLRLQIICCGNWSDAVSGNRLSWIFPHIPWFKFSSGLVSVHESDYTEKNYMTAWTRQEMTIKESHSDFVWMSSKVKIEFPTASDWRYEGRLRF